MNETLPYPENVIPSLRFQFCPMCKTELTRAVLFDDNIPRVTCPACGWIYTQSNVAAVASVVHYNGGIVVILPPGLPPETPAALPAGLVEYGESPEESALREILEETGLEAEIVRSLGWFYHPYFKDWPGPMVYFLYEARAVGGKLKGSDEGDARVYPLEALPAIPPQRAGSWRAMQMFLEMHSKE
ncbi:MAG: NUDIX domain-containing protein [Chloroflexota bacterium]